MVTSLRFGFKVWNTVKVKNNTDMRSLNAYAINKKQVTNKAHFERSLTNILLFRLCCCVFYFIFFFLKLNTNWYYLRKKYNQFHVIFSSNWFDTNIFLITVCYLHLLIENQELNWILWWLLWLHIHFSYTIANVRYIGISATIYTAWDIKW